jgi:hypothetical protein
MTHVVCSCLANHHPWWVNASRTQSPYVPKRPALILLIAHSCLLNSMSAVSNQA